MVRAHPDARHVNNDWGEQVRALRLKIDQERARVLGINPQSVARQLGLMISGAGVTDLRDHDRTLEVVVRLSGNERQDIDALPGLMLQTASGRMVPYRIAPRRAGDVATCYANPAKAERELGWKATRGLEQMMADTWRWQSRNPRGYHTPDSAEGA